MRAGRADNVRRTADFHGWPLLSPTGASPELPARAAAHDMAACDARLAQLERMTRDLSSELAWANERLLAEMYDHNDEGDGALLGERNDEITGLPNRSSFEVRVQQLLAAHLEESEPAALVLRADAARTMPCVRSAFVLCSTAWARPAWCSCAADRSTA